MQSRLSHFLTDFAPSNSRKLPVFVLFVTPKLIAGDLPMTSKHVAAGGETAAMATGNWTGNRTRIRTVVSAPASPTVLTTTLQTTEATARMDLRVKRTRTGDLNLTRLDRQMRPIRRLPDQMPAAGHTPLLSIAPKSFHCLS